MRVIKELISLLAIARAAAIAIPTAGAGAQTAQADRIIATITHPSLGAIPPAPCATSPVVSSFVETTPTTAPTQGGSFSVELQSTCVAAFAQAAAAGTPMSAQFAFMNGATPLMTYTLSTAFISQVSLALSQVGSAMMPVVRIEIAAQQVSVTYPKPAKPEAAKPALVTREKAPAFQLRSIALPAATSGESWATGGVHASMTLATDTPPMNVTFVVTGFHVVDPALLVAWSNINGSLVPRASVQVSGGRSSSTLDFTKPADASSAQIRTAASSRPAIKNATLTLIGAPGTAGITVTTTGLFCSDQANGSSEILSLSGMVTITDVGSGRHATFASGKGGTSGGGMPTPACS